ncbi:MAG TPA: VCBS repeat-containing protein [Bacteroidales bacterium]|nr:VCBS repeat-containing protein [Bacteroidales bacterium]
MYHFRTAFIIPLFILALSCNKNHSRNNSLFTLLDTSSTGITFFNTVEYTEQFNTYTYRNFYNGAGVGIADFNNDSLPDLYFCGNMVENKLYINKGNFSFEDITEKSGVACKDVWCTGVSIADVNGDGWQDIYVCKSGNPESPHRNNELFINNHDLTFSEKSAEYGLDVTGLSNHASFFDYDRDGDLDCYLLNNSFQSVTEFDIKPHAREKPDSLGGNRLFRNDGGHFTDVSREAGIYTSKIGFGLGVSVGDLNRDGWPDIYVSNDFFERDYLYINNGHGTFRECLEDEMQEISLGAMGADIADINNDTWPEVFATEMTPEDNARYKTKVLFEDWDRYRMKADNGYYRQFARNVLQLNNRNGTFSEIGRYSGVSRTDWSWGALIMDMDNDGWKDIFVANGIFKDLLDRDYLDFYSNPRMMRSLIQTEQKAILKIIGLIPSVPVPNYAFHNNADLTFTNQSQSWGLNTPSFSNGAAYGDLDNDGDLDLVVNNVNMAPFIYRNNSEKSGGNRYLEIRLKGEGMNTSAIGTSATLYYNNTASWAELYPMRGFQSTMDSRLHFGLGRDCELIDSLVVIWPNGKKTVKHRVEPDRILTLEQKESLVAEPHVKTLHTEIILKKIPAPAGLQFTCKENRFNDFSRNSLLFIMASNESPHIAVADVNGDKLDDIYVCGAKGTAGRLMIQDNQGEFKSSDISVFAHDSLSEDTDCAFFDADGDEDKDLYVTSGGSEFPASSSALRDRLYTNDGHGNFRKSPQSLPVSKFISSSCVSPADYDNDGDIDLFVGGRLIPLSYGVPANGYLLENDGKGNFRNITDQKAPELNNAGMITCMQWVDMDNDGDQDIIIAGEWMPVRVFLNNKGKNFTEATTDYGLQNTSGWWHSMAVADLNRDGKMDIILGNHGLNSFFKTSDTQPVTMYVNDFDMNGSVEQVIAMYENGRLYPVAMRDELVNQIPSLLSKFPKFSSYMDATVEDLFAEPVLNRSLVLKAYTLQTCILINNGKAPFTIKPLPAEAQLAPVYSILAKDFDHDGFCDILLGGNQFSAKPQTGIYAGGYGLLLKGSLTGAFETIDPERSGISITGQIRNFQMATIKNKQVILVGLNDEPLLFYELQK